MSNFQYEMSNLFVATSHVDGTPEGTSNTGTKDEEGGVDKELISGTTEEQEGVGGSLEESLLSSNVVGSVDERHF